MPDAREYRAAAQQAQDAYESLGAGAARGQAFVDMTEFRLMARHLECGHPCPDGCEHCVPLWCGTPRARQERLKLARWARRMWKRGKRKPRNRAWLYVGQDGPGLRGGS